MQCLGQGQRQDPGQGQGQCQVQGQGQGQRGPSGMIGTMRYGGTFRN